VESSEMYEAKDKPKG